MRNKSGKRSKLLKSIISTLKSSDIYETINYRGMNESRIKQFIYPYLLNKLTSLYQKECKVSESTARKKAKESLLWEGNVNTTISNNLFMGTSHRPDMIIDFNGITIAIEVKRGCNGSGIREGIGQTLVYSNVFDFIICLFVDTTKDKRILNASTSKEEKKFVESIWKKHNIKFEVI